MIVEVLPEANLRSLADIKDRFDVLIASRGAEILAA